MMFVKILVVIVLLSSAPNAFAGVLNLNQSSLYYPNGIDSVVGTIRSFSRNSVDIYDESGRKVRRFVYLTRYGDFKAGDRVRLYYYIQTNVVEDIKGMTLVEYQEKGANQGYLIKEK
ncbi:MAG: hypothetical protein KGK03_09565 [Candidatus Omnitrophica bacterium]|nr:hypothetical protein [Candidatus Omnitrophota bacterium]